MKPQASASSGLEELARKYISKAFKVKPRSVGIIAKRGSMSVKLRVDGHVPTTKFASLIRILKSKGLKAGNIKSNMEMTSNKASSEVSFELETVKFYRKSKKSKPKRRAVKASIGDHHMNSAFILADSLAQNFRFSAVTASVDKMLVQADGGGMGIKVMRAGEGARLVQQLYQDYISDKDYTGFLEFYKTIDDAMYKFRGNKELDLNSLEDDDDDDRGSRRRGKKGKKSFAPKTSKAMRPPKDDSDDSPPDPSDQSVVISKDAARQKTLATLNKYYS